MYGIVEISDRKIQARFSTITNRSTKSRWLNGSREPRYSLIFRSFREERSRQKENKHFQTLKIEVDSKLIALILPSRLVRSTTRSTWSSSSTCRSSKRNRRDESDREAEQTSIRGCLRSHANRSPRNSLFPRAPTFSTNLANAYHAFHFPLTEDWLIWSRCQVNSIGMRCN